MRCGLTGEKLGHSHSKTLHGLLADYRYDLIELAPEELGQRYGAAILSRIEGGYEILPFFGEDIRRKR